MESSSEDRLSPKVATFVRSRLLQSAIQTGYGIALVWLLAKTDFAVLGLLLFLYELARQLALSGFPESVLYFFEEHPQHRREVALRTIRIIAVTSTVAAGVLVVVSRLAPLILSSWDPTAVQQIVDLLPWVALLLPFELPSWPLTHILLGLNRQREAGIFEGAANVTRVVGLLLPLIAGFGVAGVVYGGLIYGVLRLVVALIWLRRVLPAPGPSPLPAGSLRQQAAFSVPLGLSAVAGRFNRYIDKMVVAAMLPAAALADYTVATYEIPLVTAFPYGVGTVLVSRYAALRVRGRVDDLVALWHRAARKVGLLVVPVGVCFLVLAPDLIPLIFGDEYQGAVVPFQLFCLLLTIRVAQYGSAFQAFGDTRSVLRFTLSMLLVNAVLSIPLTWLWGVNGTALGTVCSHFVALGMTLVVLGRHFGLPVHQVMPLKHYASVYLVSIMAGGLAWALRGWIGPRYGVVPALGAAAALYFLCYFGAATAAGLIRRDDWRSLGILARGPRG